MQSANSWCRCALSLIPRLLCMGGEKRAWYTLFAHAQFPQDFGNFRKICSVTLTSARHLYKRCLPLTTLCVDDDNGATKVLSSSLAGIVQMFIHSSQMLQHVTDEIFPFEVHRSPQTKQCRPLPSKRYCF